MPHSIPTLPTPTSVRIAPNFCAIPTKTLQEGGRKTTKRRVSAGAPKKRLTFKQHVPGVSPEKKNKL